MERHLNSDRNRNHETRRTVNHQARTAAEAEVEDWVRQVLRKTEKTPTLLREAAGDSACCIFRVPQSLVEINEKAYQPRIVSIGPYHNGLEHLKIIEEHKWRFLGSLLERKEDCDNILQNCFLIIASLEPEIRACYSETNMFKSHEFVEMMVLDGCFIIELVCKVTGLIRREPDDPIFKMDWILPFLMRDLLKLENQIPFFVLQNLFDILEPNPTTSLVSRTLRFFSDHVLERPESVLSKADNLQAKHILDLVRLSFRPSSPKRPVSPSKKNFLLSFQPAEKLHRAGIQFTTRRNKDSFLDIKFADGVLRIPPLPMDDIVSSFFLNCVAFEQCYGHCEKFITDYARFMGCLIHTSSDAGFLCDHKIIENCFGTDDEVARFFTDVGKDVAFDIERSYLAKSIEEVNEYYWNDWHVRWASFKNKYFDTPWSFISASAAAVLLILTMIQTFFAWYSYAYPRKNN
ncbi:hypothetical protein Pint_33713 [Pistacia integerrima]|uniref:Uncharacterized protein n=1 Tax=Pistacia integerrima TaxID=434235 RepID=A0ACC0X7Z3_9ROSI|nr:hypothetical protein Pint_33713 [Pistacia integerrima]